MQDIQPVMHADTPHILVVDDDEYIRAVLRAFFEIEDYQVAEAADGAIALTYVRQSGHPLIIITDNHMPHLDGEQLVQAVTSDPALATRHRFIYCTAQYQTLSLHLRMLLRDLAIPIVAKPFDLDEILALVQRIALEMQASLP